MKIGSQNRAQAFAILGLPHQEARENSDLAGTTTANKLPVPCRQIIYMKEHGDKKYMLSRTSTPAKGILSFLVHFCAQPLAVQGDGGKSSFSEIFRCCMEFTRVELRVFRGEVQKSKRCETPHSTCHSRRWIVFVCHVLPRCPPQMTPYIMFAAGMGQCRKKLHST